MKLTCAFFRDNHVPYIKTVAAFVSCDYPALKAKLKNLTKNPSIYSDSDYH